MLNQLAHNGRQFVPKVSGALCSTLQVNKWPPPSIIHKRAARWNALTLYFCLDCIMTQSRNESSIEAMYSSFTQTALITYYRKHSLHSTVIQIGEEPS